MVELGEYRVGPGNVVTILFLRNPIGKPGYRETTHGMTEFKFFFRMLQQILECFMSQRFLLDLLIYFNFGESGLALG
ncbi:hypothetical protein AKJ16_DCAP07212 [Drosera capensis]